jgi:hypothetical protein
MSKLETPLTRKYWKRMGGTLIEEFPVVKRSKTAAPRWIDGVKAEQRGQAYILHFTRAQRPINYSHAEA